MQSTPLIHKGWLRVILFLTAYLLFALFGSALITVMAVFLFPDNGSLSLFYSSILFTFFAGLLLVLFFRKTFDRQSFASLGFSWKGFGKERMAGFITGVLLITTLSAILWLMKLLQWFVTGTDIPGMLIIFCLFVLVAVGEELVFRGYILNNLMQSMPKEAALFFSALLFAGFHSLNPNFNLIAFVNIFIAGVLLGINYIYTKNLWFGIFFHFSWNFFQGPLLGFQVSGIELPSLLQQTIKDSVLLTGGGFGLEASWLATLACSITAISLYFIFQKKYSASTVE